MSSPDPGAVSAPITLTSIGTNCRGSTGSSRFIKRTRDNREIRITGWFDRHAGRYVAEFEKRTAITSGGQQLRVRAQTPAYAKCVGDDLVSCLEAAVLEVDRPVY